MRSEGSRKAWPAVVPAIATPAFGLGSYWGTLIGIRQGRHAEDCLLELGKVFMVENSWVCQGGAGAVENSSEHFFSYVSTEFHMDSRPIESTGIILPVHRENRMLVL